MATSLEALLNKNNKVTLREINLNNVLAFSLENRFTCLSLTMLASLRQRKQN